MDLLNLTSQENVSGYRYNADYSEREVVAQTPLFVSFGLKVEI